MFKVMAGGEGCPQGWGASPMFKEMAGGEGRHPCSR